MVKDRLGMHAFGNDLDAQLEGLSASLIQGRWMPSMPFKFYVPKASLTQRTYTLLMVEDALVYQAIADGLATRCYEELALNEEFIFGSVLSPETARGVDVLTDPEAHFFFFRMWKDLYRKFSDSVIDAIEKDKVRYKFETDITGFFDAIPHFNLLQTLEEDFGIDPEVLELLSECLNAWCGTRDGYTPGVGIPQGPLPSHLLANLLLHPLDDQLVGDALKYYRYMDDIKVFGYEETTMMDVLVRIDRYLKTHGLSINSKKTSIEMIDPEKEDSTVKELRKFQGMATYFGTGEESEPTQKPDRKEDGAKKDATRKEKKAGGAGKGPFGGPARKVGGKSGLIDVWSLDQSGQDPTSFLAWNAGKEGVVTITDPDEIRAFWQAEILASEEEAPTLFHIREGRLVPVSAENPANDVDLIRISARYGTAYSALLETGMEKPPSEKLLPYFIAGVRSYFWRIGNYWLTLRHYKGDPLLKRELMDMLEYFSRYEFVRHFLYVLLSATQKFSDAELRDSMFRTLQREDSDLVRLAIYKLIITGTENPQLLRSLHRSASAEANPYLKMRILEDFRYFRPEAEPDLLSKLLGQYGL